MITSLGGEQTAIPSIFLYLSLLVFRLARVTFARDVIPEKGPTPVFSACHAVKLLVKAAP